MPDVSAIDEAKGWADWLVRAESRGPGDTDNAMRRLSTRYGVSRSLFWSLRYRPPKDIFASVYLKLRAAYAAEHERQLARLADELARTRIQAGPHSHLYRAAARVAGEEVRDDENQPGETLT